MSPQERVSGIACAKCGKRPTKMRFVDGKNYCARSCAPKKPNTAGAAGKEST